MKESPTITRLLDSIPKNAEQLIERECKLTFNRNVGMFTKSCTDAVLMHLSDVNKNNKEIADVSFEQFYMGMNVELEHGIRTAETNLTNDDPIMTGKIALVHLLESKTYYTHLYGAEKAMDKEKELASRIVGSIYEGVM